MDDNKDRFRYDGPPPQTAGDDLIWIAARMADLRDFLLGLHYLAEINETTLLCMSSAEEAVQDVFAKKWHECQDILRAASSADLAETETEWMGEKLPGYFSGTGPRGSLTLDEYRALRERSKPKQIRTGTNPATLLSTNRLGERDE